MNQDMSDDTASFIEDAQTLAPSIERDLSITIRPRDPLCVLAGFEYRLPEMFGVLEAWHPLTYDRLEGMYAALIAMRRAKYLQRKLKAQA